MFASSYACLRMTNDLVPNRAVKNTRFLARITKTDAAGLLSLQQSHRHKSCRWRNCFPRGVTDFRSHTIILAGKRQTKEKRKMAVNSA